MKYLNPKKTFLLSLSFASILILLLSLYTYAQLYQKGDLYMGKTNIKKKNLENILTEEQYHVTIDNGTEPPFRNAYWDNKKEGIYVDVISGEALFISKNKFNSGTGWPSFTKPIDKEHIIEKVDRALGMSRTEVRSKKSNAHLGHVFNDGPAPTGQRYCINSAALRFIPVDKMDQEGYTKYQELFNEGN
jgi:methionine-R-sulfoxide reductase